MAQISSLSKERSELLDEEANLLEEVQELADQGDLEEALMLCEKCLHAYPASVQGHFLMGLIYQALDNDEKAEESLYKTVYLEPNHDEALYYLAFIAEHHGDQEKAQLLHQRIERIQKKRHITGGE